MGNKPEEGHSNVNTSVIERVFQFTNVKGSCVVKIKGLEY